MPSAIVIGAGPAGSVAAFVLARAGWDVTIIEQHRFPRDKVCGECLSALGIECLARLGLNATVRQAGAVPLRATNLHSTAGTSARVDLPNPMWGLSRSALDSVLLKAAREAGAVAIQPARVEHVERQSIRVRDLESNQVRELRADHILIADGKAPKRRWRDFGIKAHFEGIRAARDAIELFGCRGFYGGLAPIENERWNIAFSVPAQLLRQFNGDVDALFRQVRAENRALDQRLRSATRVSRWLSSPLPRFQAQAMTSSNALRVGNAAAALEPIGGEGMGLAMTSAEIAANALIDGQLDLVSSQYKSLWQVRKIACRLAGMVVSRPALLRPSIHLLRASTSIPSASLALIGK